VHTTPQTAFLCLTWLIAAAAFAGGMPVAECERLFLEVVRRADDHVLWAHPVRAGENFTIDYRHSSDHTPVHDTFQITAEGAIILVEERFDWYGSGLEFHPSADISASGSQTLVRLHRPFPEIPLRVGEVAGHVLTVQGMRLPLLSVAKGRESVCIRITRQPRDGR
jgi:hypothetical protein